MSDPATPPPDLLEEVVAILTDDATYDEPIQARVHMVENVLRGSDLELEDAVVATALSMSTPLGLLAGEARQRIQTICEATGLSITTVETGGGFVTDVDELITVAAYQATRSDLLPQEKEQRLLYLYGGASEDLGLDVDPEAFKDRVSERAASDPPDRSDLPARAAAAEIKQQSGLSQADAREGVQQLLVLDPAVAPERSADTEAESEAAADTPDPDSESESESESDAVDPDLVEFWGCPFCSSTNDSLGSIKAHMTGASRPPHKGVNGHKPSHHIPGYDESGVLMAAFEQWVQGESSAVLRAPTVDTDGWYTEAQAAAARADVPIQTQHTEDTVERAPETDEILSTVATASADHSPADQAGATEPSEEHAGADGDEDTATGGQEGADPDIAPGETTSPMTDPGSDSDPTPVATADPDDEEESSSGRGGDPSERPPRAADTASADATTGSSPSADSPVADSEVEQDESDTGATDSTPTWTAVPEDESDRQPGADADPVTPPQSSTEPRGTADEMPSTFLPDDDTTTDTPAATEQTVTDGDDDPAGPDHTTADPGEPEAETGAPATDQPGESSGPAEADSTEEDDETSPAQDEDSERAWVLEAPGLRIAEADDADGDAVADVEVRSLDDREAVLETALAIHHHERIPNGEKPDLLATLVEDATADVDPQTVREHLADAPSPDEHRSSAQSQPASKAAGSPESGRTDAEGRGDDPFHLGSDETVQTGDSSTEWTVEVREDRLETPVGTVSTQGELADAAVRVYRSSVVPADQCPAVVRALAQRADQIGITVTAEDLFEVLALRLEQDPRAQADSETGDDQPLTAAAVHDRAATTLRDDSLSTDEKVDRIQDIVSNAKKQGIEVSLEEVLTAAKAKRQDADGGN